MMVNRDYARLWYGQASSIAGSAAGASSKSSARIVARHMSARARPGTLAKALVAASRRRIAAASSACVKTIDVDFRETPSVTVR